MTTKAMSALRCWLRAFKLCNEDIDECIMYVSKLENDPNYKPEPSRRLPVPPSPGKPTLSSLDRKRVDRLYTLLERAERESDPDAAAALHWAIFTLENR